MDIKNLTSKKFHLESDLAALQEKLASIKKECDEVRFDIIFSHYISFLFKQIQNL